MYYLNRTSIAAFIDYEKKCYYQNDSISSTGILEITKYDTINRIISGRFSFNANKYYIDNITSIENCTSSITIAEGRFDMKFPQ